jgi:hypothetical protein
MKIGSFEFNLRELAGSMGDIGTLFPFAIGYIAVCGMNPAGLLVMIGLANIITGFVYRLPLPIQPMKVIAVVAIAQHWSPSMIYACGFAMGVIWLFFSITGLMVWIAKIAPNSVVRGIQVTLGVVLALKAVEMISSGWVLGIISIVIAFVLRNNRYAPSAIVLMALGLVIMFTGGQFKEVSFVSFSIPTFTSFKPIDIWPALILAGFAQIPLTATNATISTSSLIKTYWPERRVSEKQLSLNMGIMNLIPPFFGGMPLCHGAGGLAGQYYFGARTGGTNIIEGLIEISMGLFLASSIASLLKSFPVAIIGAMLFLVGIELIKFTKDIRVKKDMIPLGATIAVSLLTNMAYGFLTGLIIHYVLILTKRKTRV